LLIKSIKDYSNHFTAHCLIAQMPFQVDLVLDMLQ